MKTNGAANDGIQFPEIYTIRAEDQFVSFFAFNSFIIKCIINIGKVNGLYGC